MEKTIRMGFDRFLDKRWADYAFYLLQDDETWTSKYVLLQEWLVGEIKSKEILRKTANQLKRLWLMEDQFHELREQAAAIDAESSGSNRAVLHFGMALNVFPFFRDLCTVVGRLGKLQGFVNSSEVRHRLLEKYGTHSTIAAASRRGLLTLENWGFLRAGNDGFLMTSMEIAGQASVEWFIKAVIFNNEQVGITDLTARPEILGIDILNVRSTVQNATSLRMDRNSRNEEVISLVTQSASSVKKA